MRLLLLSCCAPCSCGVIEQLIKENQDFEVAFYNPNIKPIEEYYKRLEENKRLCQLYGIKFIELEYDNDNWSKLVLGLEDEPEKGRRCSICFYMRIKRVMQYAKEHGFDGVASVLGVSRYKNLSQVNEAAQKASKEVGFAYVEVEARKNGLQERRNNLIKELDLYSQDYCGCTPR